MWPASCLPAFPSISFRKGPVLTSTAWGHIHSQSSSIVSMSKQTNKQKNEQTSSLHGKDFTHADTHLLFFASFLYFITAKSHACTQLLLWSKYTSITLFILKYDWNSTSHNRTAPLHKRTLHNHSHMFTLQTDPTRSSEKCPHQNYRNLCQVSARWHTSSSTATFKPPHSLSSHNNSTSLITFHYNNLYLTPTSPHWSRTITFNFTQRCPVSDM